MPYEEKNQHATSFMNTKSACNNFLEQNQFRKEKYQHATRFMNKNLHARSSKNKISFTRRKINVKSPEEKINMQQVSRTKSACTKFSFMWRKINQQFLRGEKSCAASFISPSFHEETNQHATSFMNTKSACNKLLEQNQFREGKCQCKSFTKRKINVRVSRREELTCDTFMNKNQRATSCTSKTRPATSSTSKNQHTISSRNRISFTRRQINIQNFTKRKNQHATSFTNKNQHAAGST